MNKRGKSGFTLVEILVVVAIILLLAGMLFRIGSVVSDRSNRARALSDMQAIANALEEYYAVHGIYPPTSGMRYVYPDTSYQPPQMEGVEAEDTQYGLASYLFPRGSDDPERSPYDEQQKHRWQSYLTELNTRRGPVEAEIEMSDVTLVYSNVSLNVVNPWGGSYNYESEPPYLSYHLWTGVPGANETLSVSSSGQ